MRWSLSTGMLGSLGVVSGRGRVGCNDRFRLFALFQLGKIVVPKWSAQHLDALLVGTPLLGCNPLQRIPNAHIQASRRFKHHHSSTRKPPEREERMKFPFRAPHPSAPPLQEDVRLQPIGLQPPGRNRIGRSRNWPKSNRWCLLCFFFLSLLFFLLLFLVLFLNFSCSYSSLSSLCFCSVSVFVPENLN